MLSINVHNVVTFLKQLFEIIESQACRYVGKQ